MIIVEAIRAMIKDTSTRNRTVICLRLRFNMQGAPFGLYGAVLVQPPFPFSVESVPVLRGSAQRFFLKFVDVGAMISVGVENAMLS